MNGLNNSSDDVAECPLCMEPLEVDDLNFYPCTCGYQVSVATLSIMKWILITQWSLFSYSMWLLDMSFLLASNPNGRKRVMPSVPQGISWKSCGFQASVSRAGKPFAAEWTITWIIATKYEFWIGDREYEYNYMIFFYADIGSESRETPARSAAEAENIRESEAFGECESGAEELSVRCWSTASAGGCWGIQSTAYHNMYYIHYSLTLTFAPQILRKHEYFGKYGKIHKVVINPSTTYAGVQVIYRSELKFIWYMWCVLTILIVLFRAHQHLHM